MANDADPYIAAVADACQAAGLNVLDYGSDDIDPRDGMISLTKAPEGDPDGEDWRESFTLGWDEERGWVYGEPKDSHGELHNLLWIGGGALPEPARVADVARRIIAGELADSERRSMMSHVRWRDQEDDDGFEAGLAAYREHDGGGTGPRGAAMNHGASFSNGPGWPKWAQSSVPRPGTAWYDLI